MELLSKQALCRSLFAVLAFAGCLQAQTLKQIVTIDLPESKGERFDYLTMDDANPTGAHRPRRFIRCMFQIPSEKQ